jgi:hypothetical protein
MVTQSRFPGLPANNMQALSLGDACEKQLEGVRLDEKFHLGWGMQQWITKLSALAGVGQCTRRSKAEFLAHMWHPGGGSCQVSLSTHIVGK